MRAVISHSARGIVTEVCFQHYDGPFAYRTVTFMVAEMLYFPAFDLHFSAFCPPFSIQSSLFFSRFDRELCSPAPTPPFLPSARPASIPSFACMLALAVFTRGSRRLFLQDSLLGAMRRPTPPWLTNSASQPPSQCVLRTGRPRSIFALENPSEQILAAFLPLILLQNLAAQTNSAHRCLLP